jgi:trimeric autotransporter adhesin
LKRVLRGALVIKALVKPCISLMCVMVLVCLGHAQEPPAVSAATFQISGMVKSGKNVLPGVTVTAANTLTGKKVSVVSGLDGSFVIPGLSRGRYVVKIEFMGFANQTQEVLLNPENPAGKIDAELILASRQPEQASETSGVRAANRGFQNLAVQRNETANADSGQGSGALSASDLASLPMSGAGSEVATESVSVAGAQGRSQDFGNGNEEELEQRVQEFRERGLQNGGTAFGAMQGGPGGGFGGGGGGGGGGPVMMGRMGRGFNSNEPHGFLYFQDDNSGLDARPYSLTGEELGKASYNSIRFGSFVGGPVRIPHLFDWSKSTFYTVGWNGSRGSNPYDAFSTVPTQAERNGIFTGLTDNNGNPIAIYDPKTGLPFANNTIDPGRFSSAATELLNYIPLQNLPGATQNFHYVTSTESSTDALSLRLIHNFNGTGQGNRTPGGGGRGRGARGPRNNLNFGLNWSRSSSAIVNPFPSLAGNTDTQGLNANARWTYGKGRTTNIVGVTYNHNRVATTNLYSGITDVAGNAGITGISTDPFNWGLPGISFNTFGGLSGPIPSRELDETYTISDTLNWNRGKHNMRFGGDYRRILQNFRSAKNGEGSFVFTGFATSAYASGSTQPLPDTGNDFADFLLGLPQQTSLQSGSTAYDFRSNAFDFYGQDDWRILGNLSLNAGLRYEYNGPFTEAQDRIVNLDVGPGFTSAVQVFPSQTGPYSGQFPASLVRPDRNNFAPRLGLAWRVAKDTVVRVGYGINYNLAQYSSFIRNFAFQPPFAVTATNVSAYGDFLTLEEGFPSNTGTVTNNYAVDPNYRLGYVQIWNVDIQRQLPAGVQLNIGYNGAKGTRLDTERAIVAGGQPFIYESSEGNSILHAASVRVRKRMAKGLGVSASYVFSKSIDDASSIGGGGAVVAQNPFAIYDDRGLSSFDQRHKFTGTWMYDLPFGDGKRFVTRGAFSHVLDGWQWSGGFTIGSGLYFTPRVLGASLDIERGVSGSLRANAFGNEPIGLSNPTTAKWFNTAAFCAPGPDCENSTGTTYGDAGRNVIEGPAQFTVNSTISKTFVIRESRALELRMQATNIFNTAYFSNINTTVNSLTFGQVTGVGNMRRITMMARFRF